MHLNDIESKLAYFEYILSYFAIISLFWFFFRVEIISVRRRRYSVFYKSVHVWHLDSIVLIRQALFPP